MSRIALGRDHRDVPAEELDDRARLRFIVQLRPRPMRVDMIDLVRLYASEGERALHRELRPKAFGMRRRDMISVRALADALKERERVAASLDEHERAPLTDIEPAPLRRERFCPLRRERVERVKAHQGHLAERIDAADERRVDYARVDQ